MSAALALAAGLALAAPSACAQSASLDRSYPDRPIRIVVGFPPGSSADVIARGMAPKLGEGLGQSIVIENRAGAGSSLAAEMVAKAPGDGYTLLMSTIANTILLGFGPAATFAPHVKAGKLRALAVGGRTRSATLAQVPTFLEAGVGGFEAGLWFGLNAPAATSRVIVERLNRELDRVFATAEVRAQLGAQSIEPTPSSIEVFGALITAETEKWARVVRNAGIKVD